MIIVKLKIENKIRTLIKTKLLHHKNKTGSLPPPSYTTLDMYIVPVNAWEVADPAMQMHLNTLCQL
jgi:hypothetical protein